jgi:hypothetical protein
MIMQWIDSSGIMLRGVSCGRNFLARKNLSLTKYARWIAQRTHPTIFREDMQIALNSETPVKTPNYSPMLHNSILAIGLCFSDEIHLRQADVRKTFAMEAKSHLEHEGMNPTVATVQALAHLASYYSLAAEHNLGWLYIGMALRCAMARELTYRRIVGHRVH